MLMMRSLKMLFAAAVCIIVLAAASLVIGQETVYATVEPFENPDYELSFTSTDSRYERYLQFLVNGDLNIDVDLSTKKHGDKVLKVQQDDNYYVIYPVKNGSETLVAVNKDDPSDKWEYDVTIDHGYFQSVLDNNTSMGIGRAAGFGDEDPYFTVSDKIAYGSSGVLAKYPFTGGATVSFTVNGEKKDVEETSASFQDDVNVRYFRCDFAVRLKTPVTMHVKWNGASKDYNAKVVNGSKIKTKKIKANSKSGKVVVVPVHKGDYLKIKVGKKLVKTVKFKKDEPSKTVKWSVKKKMKKGTKVTYTLYNKYKEKLTTASRKVGK